MVCENKSFTRVEPGRPALTYRQGRSPQVQSLGYFVFERIHRRALFYSWFFLSLLGKLVFERFRRDVVIYLFV